MILYITSGFTYATEHENLVRPQLLNHVGLVSSCVSTFFHGTNDKNRFVFVARDGFFVVLSCFAGANSKKWLFFGVRGRSF